MINLNNIEYEIDSQVIRNSILSKFSEEDIFRHYLGDFTIGKPFSSPFRTDKNYSFAVFIGRDTGALLYNEMLYKEIGNCFKLVKNLYGLSSFRESYLKIAFDLGVTEVKQSINDIRKFTKEKKKQYTPSSLKIGVKYRKWNNRDKEFWSQFGISKKVLLEHEVKPISFIFYNDIGIAADKLAYVFPEHKDGATTFKIYQPYNEKYKWTNNHDYSVWQGWTQRKMTKYLIISSSLKDSLSIISTVNYDSIALQAETTVPKKNVMNELLNDYEKIFIFYDNDLGKKENWGQKYAKEICENYNIINIKIPDYYETKDYSDMIKEHGIEKSKEWLNSILEEKQ